MVVESNLHLDKGIVRGDAFPIRRILRVVQSGVLLEEAWLTIKALYADSDPGLIQKNITTINSSAGQIEDAGASGTGKIRFDLSEADTLLFEADEPYYFDIQIKLDNGEVRTLERGVTSALEQVTTSS